MSKEANKGKEPEKKDIETAEEAACEISEAVAEDTAEEGSAAVQVLKVPTKLQNKSSLRKILVPLNGIN